MFNKESEESFGGNEAVEQTNGAKRIKGMRQNINWKNPREKIRGKTSRMNQESVLQPEPKPHPPKHSLMTQTAKSVLTHWPQMPQYLHKQHALLSIL